MKKVRSSVSANISKNVIWINSTNYESTIKALKIHEILMEEFGYTDGLTLEEGNLGKGVSLTVCSSFWTVREMQEHYAEAKKKERETLTTKKHEAEAREFMNTLYGQEWS